MQPRSVKVHRHINEIVFDSVVTKSFPAHFPIAFALHVVGGFFYLNLVAAVFTSRNH